MIRLPHQGLRQSDRRSSLSSSRSPDRSSSVVRTAGAGLCAV